MRRVRKVCWARGKQAVRMTEGREGEAENLWERKESMTQGVYSFHFCKHLEMANHLPIVIKIIHSTSLEYQI